LARALIGYLNPNLHWKYPVFHELQNRLAENAEFIDLESCTNLLTELSVAKKGSKDLIEGLKKWVFDLMKYESEDTYMYVPKLILAFNLIGATSDDYACFLNIID